ncbi:MAG: VIT1/CCC1 transporter family protein [Sulfuriferula sp.]
MTVHYPVEHRIKNIGWLRAAVLGANDGIVSTSSLILGVSASHALHHSILVAGVSGLVAGALSMATGEYVSVHSQSDSEKTALNEEQSEIESNYPSELRELTVIYIKRGLDHDLASQVAEQLMIHDALGAHAHDELGISPTTKPRPLQAALTSACSFSVGAALPLSIVAIFPATDLIPIIGVASLVFLGLLGGFGAHIGGASVIKGAMRVMFWSALAMLVTTGIGRIFETTS